jgi:WD40 repeat protein
LLSEVAVVGFPTSPPHNDRESMATSQPLRVFISYARKDGTPLAKRLESDLAKQGVDVWLDTPRIDGGAVWTRKIEQEVDTRQVTIALLSPGSYESEICRAEQLRALDKGNRVIPVLVVKGTDRPLYLYARQYRDFSDYTNYAVRLGELLADIRGDATATLPDTYRKTRVTYLTAPPRVANYLERPEAIHALRDALFAEDHRQPIALTALAGMGGIGKTVLAKALTDDEVVQRAFPDGIVWVTAGRDRKRDFIEEMREVAKALGDDLSGYDNALACEHQYRSTIANKAALIVVDDVWSKTDIEPLLAESRRSRFLFTTRDASIGRFVGAHEHRADLLDVAQSRVVLAAWAKLPVAELPTTADEIIAQCGRLPLALSVVGAMLRDATAEFWTDILDLLRKADLSAIEEQLPEGQESFFKAVEVSVRSLKPKMQERYKALAVLPEDMPAPLPILQTLWNANAAEARRISRHFDDRSLAWDVWIDKDCLEPGSNWVATLKQSINENQAILLHDLQFDYVQALYPDRNALELIHVAVRLSSHVISRDSKQFVSQVVARLLPHQNIPAIAEFIKRAAEGAPTHWLRLTQPTLHSPGSKLQRKFTGHSGGVTAVAVTPDGQRAVSASDDHTLKIWDLGSGRELRTLTGHSGRVTAVAVTPDGQRAVSASNDQMLKVWDLATGRELLSLTGHSDVVTAVALKPDGQQAVSASFDRTLKVWDLATGCELHTLTGHSYWVTAVAVTPDGQRAVSASYETLEVWDLTSGRKLDTLMSGDSDWVNAVAVTPDGRWAVSASSDRMLKVWDLASGRELRSLAGHSSGVDAVAVTADGQRAVSASSDKTLKVWDLISGRELHSLTGHSDGVTAVAVTPDGQRAVSASHDRTLKVWDLTNGRVGHSAGVPALAVTPDGQRAVSASFDKTLKVWDLVSGHEPCSLTGHSDGVTAVSLTPDGQRAVSASWDQTLKVWDLISGRELHTLTGHSDGVTAVAVTPDGQRAISASRDNTVKMWELETDELLATFSCDGAANCCAFSEALELIVVGDAGGHVHFLHLEEPKNHRD